MLRFCNRQLVPRRNNNNILLLSTKSLKFSSFLVSSKRWQSTTTSDNNNKTDTTKTPAQQEPQQQQEQQQKESVADNQKQESTSVSNTENKITSEEQNNKQNSTKDVSETSADSTKDDLSLDLEVEPVRWDVPVWNEDIVDEKGQYIVSKFPWKTGELAYTTPAAPLSHEARFGYQVVVVKKPQSYWSWYRRANFFSFTHIWYQLAFALGVCWVLTWIQLETNYLYAEMRRPGNLAGDQLGKGDANRHAKKITVSAEERDEVLQAMQNAFLDGKDLTSKGSKDYRMKKIPRPKEFNVQDYMRN